jgi:HPt (histidine-containing phosphotransfer) domain-containing protein
MPFIILTANITEEAQDACKALEVKYLSKPLRGRLLQAAVQTLLLSENGKDSVNREPWVSDDMVGDLIDENVYDELVGLLGQGPRLGKLVSEFFHDADTLINKMTKAMNEKDNEQLGDLAHGLKGAAMGIGAKQLAQEARSMEQMMREGTSSGQEDTMTRIQAAYRSVRSLLAERTDSQSDSGRMM